LGKMSQPEEVAKLVAFLISEEQSSISGQTLDINNGALMP
jgi:NAD(P)-dependent dehydrogenase (short-subunit alcohol dehydrogenase family)